MTLLPSIKRHLLSYIGMIFAILSIPSIRAQLYEVRINATLSAITNYGTGYTWDSSIQNGVPMTAVFTCDTAAAPASSSGTSTHWNFNTLTSSISVGNYTLSSSGTHLAIYNNNANYGDGYQLDSFGTVSNISGLYGVGFAARIWDSGIPASTILSDMLQPVQVLPLAGFHEAYLTIFGYTDPGFSYVSTNQLTAYQTVTSYTVTAIPEPSTYAALFGLAALGFAAYRRKKSV